MSVTATMICPSVFSLLVVGVEEPILVASVGYDRTVRFCNPLKIDPAGTFLLIFSAVSKTAAPALFRLKQAKAVIYGILLVRPKGCATGRFPFSFPATSSLATKPERFDVRDRPSALVFISRQT